MKIKGLIIISVTGLLLVGCGNKSNEETKRSTTSTTNITQTSRPDTSLEASTIESTALSTSSSEDMTDNLEITEEQAIEIANKIAKDFQKLLIGTFEDTDTSSSWGATISITFNEDDTILMSESEKSFQKTNLKYEGTYTINSSPVASNLLDIIDQTDIDDKANKIKECLELETYDDYNSFVHNVDMVYLPVTIDTTVNGHKSKEISNEKHLVEAELKYNNLKLEMSYSTRLFKSANQVALTKK